MVTTESPPITPSDQDLDIDKIMRETEEQRIELDAFKGNPDYTPDEISEDMTTCEEIVTEIEKRIANYDEERRRRLERGLKAEFVFRHAIQEYGWLAEDLKLIITSQYDDYVSKIDSVAQVESGQGKFEYIGFAIDFAIGSEDVEQKLSATFSSLDQGETPAVKYFSSEKTGQIKNFKMPRIVIGAGRSALDRLSAYSSEIMNGSGIAASVIEEIKNDSFRYTLFGEIIGQLSVFINRLKKVIEIADTRKNGNVEKRAQESLSIHEKTLLTVQRLMSEADIDLPQIHKHIRGDSFAVKMAENLSTLSQRPIYLDLKQAPKK